MTDLQQRQALVNLGPWLERCEAAGVPYVPAEFSEPFPVEELYRAMDMIERHRDYGMESTPALQAALLWLEGRRLRSGLDEPPWMARWECCSSEEMKYHMGKGGGWDTAMMWLTLDDPRLFDCLASETLRICVRPWVEAMRIGGYPVEFRVFYGPGGYQGLSSYYPQRPLIWLDVDFYVYHVADIAGRLISIGEYPAGCTMDFIITEAGEALFLEGGPPHVLDVVSAHPCCFKPGKVNGLALAAMEGAVR